tara:strand:- start:469 stop:927 length:459 start_codon:yes stop_codon:yes gene_type:complete
MKHSWGKFVNEGKDKAAGIVVCLNDEQQFLVIKRSKADHRAGQWTIPGGHIDDDDNSIEDGALRELEEETGLKCSKTDLIYLGEPKNKKYYFLTRKWTGEVDVLIPNPESGIIEHDDFKWLTINEVKDLENSEIPIYLLEKALKFTGLDKDA